jgi:hypothetical protein
MDILVDYDNVLPQMKREGLLNFCSRVINAIANRKMHFAQRCRMRLYGGWYETKSLTERAKALITEIQQNFPGVVPWSTNKSSGQSLAKVEMAYSLEVQPGRHLFYTLRVRDFSEPIQCNESRVRRCGEPNCPVRIVSDFFRQKKCPSDGCHTLPGDVLRKQEQKLVDTMITADLIHLAKSGEHDLALVSSDDDLWPGVQTALLYGARVIQVHTREGREMPESYITGLDQYKHTAL